MQSLTLHLSSFSYMFPKPYSKGCGLLFNRTRQHKASFLRLRLLVTSPSLPVQQLRTKDVNKETRNHYPDLLYAVFRRTLAIPAKILFKMQFYAECSQTNYTATDPDFRSYPVYDVPNSLKVSFFLYHLMPQPCSSNLNNQNKLAIAMA